MREIKFRAWDTEKKEMRRVTGINWYDEHLWVDETPMSGDRLPIEGTPLMQFTGLKDKNGKEIYEGDIVVCSSMRGDNCVHEVIWEEANPFSHMGGWNLRGLTANYDWIGTEELRGNIYENPDLLK